MRQPFEFTKSEIKHDIRRIDGEYSDHQISAILYDQKVKGNPKAVLFTPSENIHKRLTGAEAKSLNKINDKTNMVFYALPSYKYSAKDKKIDAKPEHLQEHMEIATKQLFERASKRPEQDGKPPNLTAAFNVWVPNDKNNPEKGGHHIGVVVNTKGEMMVTNSRQGRDINGQTLNEDEKFIKAAEKGFKQAYQKTHPGQETKPRINAIGLQEDSSMCGGMTVQALKTIDPEKSSLKEQKNDVVGEMRKVYENDKRSAKATRKEHGKILDNYVQDADVSHGLDQKGPLPNQAQSLQNFQNWYNQALNADGKNPLQQQLSDMVQGIYKTYDDGKVSKITATASGVHISGLKMEDVDKGAKDTIDAYLHQRFGNNPPENLSDVSIKVNGSTALADAIKVEAKKRGLQIEGEAQEQKLESAQVRQRAQTAPTPAPGSQAKKDKKDDEEEAQQQRARSSSSPPAFRK